ncbi:MAG: hypothetical protein M3203_01685, partial [Actinomycetota bacterium]|nr:hypothetical protein [Actinomycetota bacterium]
MTEEPLDLRRSLRALRRQWRTVAAILVAGLAVGVLLTLLSGRTFEARSAVLLPPSPVDATGRPLRNMLTETRIARSAEVVGPVGRELVPPVAASRLAKRVNTAAVGSDILDIRARAGSASEAVTVANGVAREYINFSTNATAEKTNTSIALLRDTAAALQSQIARLEAEIAAGSAHLRTLPHGSPDAVQQSALLDTQRAAQVDATRQLSALDSRVADARLDAELTRRGYRILEPATAAAAPWRRAALVRVGLGGLVGSLGGVLLAIYLGHGDRRLRTRDEIARAAGVPVLASMGVRRPRRVDEWRRLLERWTPTPAERLVLRQAFTRIGEPQARIPTNIAVVTLAGDIPALALAVELAGFSADFGIPTRLVLAVQDKSAAQLRSAAVVAFTPGTEVRPHLSVVDGTKDLET